MTVAPSARLANALLAIFCAVVTCVVLYIYYVPDFESHTNLRLRIENKLYDVRTRLAPAVVSTEQVGVIEISAESIAAIEGPAKGDEVNDLSYANLIRTVEKTLRLGPKKIVVLLQPQVFAYANPDLARLANLAAKDSRVVFGTYGLESFPKDSERIPLPLRKVPEQIFSASDGTREFRRNVVREIAIYQEEGLQMLPWHLAQNTAAESYLADAFPKAEGVRHMRLNYVAPHRIKSWDASEVLADRVASLENKVIYLGYTDYRPWTFRDREATHVNTPWQADGDEVQDGMPIVYLQAIAALNILERAWLTPAPVFVNVMQTLLVVIICLFVWRFSVGFASFLIIGFWCFLIVLHALLFSLANVYVPLADAILFSTIAALAGALWKLRLEGRQRALQEARAASERELASSQERFLDRFATELAKINDNVYACLDSQRAAVPADQSIRQAFSATIGSCEELRDYLRGIEQFARVTGELPRQEHLEKVAINFELEKILRQFDSRKSTKKLTIKVVGDTCFAHTDRTLFSQILFNLISNAIKYSPEGGLISIKIYEDGQELLLAVTDNGPGIVAENQEKIFEKFYRVKDDNVYKIKGHGLGLYLSRYFAGRIGASISLVSAFGEGSTFTLHLPHRDTR